MEKAESDVEKSQTSVCVLGAKNIVGREQVLGC